MDFHILIVISCVVLFSLLSLLLINRFFRRKTFEEVVAEKRAFTEKIYGQQKAVKKPKKIQIKKVMKFEKKQRQKVHSKKAITTTIHEDSDAQSDLELASLGLSKIHVEFEPEPEVVTFATDAATKISIPKTNAKKQKKNEKKTGILVNKYEAVAIKTTPVEETNFEVKHPKDVLELKKADTQKYTTSKKGKENRKEKSTATNVTTTIPNAGPANFTNPVPVVVVNEPKVEVKDVKPQEEKIRHTSPKNTQTFNTNNTNKNKQHIKKQNKETSATKELVQALDKLAENDTVGVSLLMNLFRRAELNRSEIQILIDYLLNRQQDMPTTHSDWSDDQCQKLKRQLEEKERALAEEQKASIGLQTKLRELRMEINMERLQVNATVKAYTEKLQAKEQELVNLNQEVQSLNEKLTVERQQFQAKLIREKQAATQDLLSQVQSMKSDIAHKDKCFKEMNNLINDSRKCMKEAQQRTEIIKQQSQEICNLEQQCDELEQANNNQIFELEKLKTLETESSELKVETRNLQNALESAKADVVQALQENDNLKAEVAHLRNFELNEQQLDIQTLQAKNAELSQQLASINNKTLEQSKDHSDLQALLHNLQGQLAEKERLLTDFNVEHADLMQRLQHMAHSTQQQNVQQQDLQQRVDNLLADMNNKDQLLQEMEQRSQQLNSREKELLQQLQEHKEKNNELRLKNWKLIDALQSAEQKIISQHMLTTSNTNLVHQQQMLSAIQTPASTVDTATKEQAKIRSLYERLYPEAVKTCAGIALSASFDKWVEQVVSTHIQQEMSNSIVPTPATATATTNTVVLSSSHKATQSNSSNNNASATSNGAAINNLHNDTSLSNSSNSSSSSNNNNNNNINSSSSNSSDENSSQLNNNNTLGIVDTKNDSEVQTLQLQNAQLRAKIDELTKLVTKTSNTLSDLESHAREQEEHWRSVVRAQEEKIQVLQHSNGEQDV